MSERTQIDNLSDEIMKGLKEYAEITSDKVKSAVKTAGETAVNEIKSNAPHDTGKYAKSWSVKTAKETSDSLVLTVYSRDHYRLTHLLEFGHAKRNGGRVPAQPHIASAEEKSVEKLEEEIRKSIEDG